MRDVTEEIENELIAKMLEVLEQFRYTQLFRNPAPLLKLSRYLEEDADFYRPLVRVNGSELFMEKLKKVFTDHMLHDSDIPDDMRHSKWSACASATLRAGSSIFTGSGSAAIWTVRSMMLRWRSASCCI